MNRKYTVTVFAAGLLGGFLAFKGLLSVSDHVVVPQADLARDSARLEQLDRENRELQKHLNRAEVIQLIDREKANLPYSESADAVLEVSEARERAHREGRILMVTFGANWCLDCRNLHRQLKSEEVRTYTDSLFDFVNVNVGKFNQNRDVAEDLGVELSRGIPVAIFFDPSGQVIGTTNQGQLEPARHYSSKQILKFVRDVAERSRISAPDSVD
jgi:protein disulfide-isomerase